MSDSQLKNGVNLCVQIGCWQANPQTNELKNGQVSKRIEPKAMAVLMYLLTHSTRVISTEELLTQIWGDIVVTPNTVRRIIAQLRKVLHEKTDTESYIRTIPRRGYQLVAPHQFIEQVTESPNKITRVTHFRYAKSALGFAALLLLTAIMLLSTKTSSTKQQATNYQVTPITSIPGRELNPTLSARHQAIIFSHLSDNSDNYQLRIKKLGDAQSIALQGASGSLFAPAWSSLDKLAFANIADRQCKILIADIQPQQAQLSNVEQVFDCNGNGFPQLSWSNNGKTLFFNGKDKADGRYHLYQYQLDTKQVLPLNFTQRPDDEFFKIVPSANDKIFGVISFYGQQSHIWRYDIEQDQLQLVFKHQGKNESIAWCNQGNTLMFGYQQQLWQVDNNGQASAVNDLSEKDFSYLSCHQQMPGIYFTARERATSLVTFANPSVQHITPIDPNGYQFRSTFNELAPAWAHHSQRLAFISDRLGTWQLYLSDEHKNLTTIKQLSFTQPPSAIHWSPDDKHLLVVVAKQVLSYELSTKQVTELINASMPISEAVWSHDNQGIYYLTQQSNNLQYLDISTGVSTIFTRFEQTPTGISMLSLAPDKPWLFYLKNNHTDLWRLDLSTKTQSLFIADLFTGGYFQAFAQGIYFYRELGDQSGTYFYDHAHQQVKPVLTQFGDQGVQLSVSYDQKKLTYVSQDGYQANIKVLHRTQ